MPKISVIIPVYKDEERLNKCIDALDRQTYPKTKFEVIVINNDVGDDINVSKNFGFEMHIFRETKPGSYAARNLGIKHAKWEILAFIDSDCIPASDWIEKGVNFLSSKKDNNIILAGKIELFYRNKLKLTIAECYEKVFAFPHQKFDNELLDGMVTANVFISSKTFKEIGLFNNNLLSGGDSDFSLRARKNNYLIYYSPDCVVNHPARHSMNNLIKKRRRVFNGKVYRDILDNRSPKLKSVFRVLAKQIIRYLNELFQAVKTRSVTNITGRIKLLAAILAIMVSLCSESLYILLTDRRLR